MSRSTFLKTSTSSTIDGNETTSLVPTTTNPVSDPKRTLRFHHRLMPTISSSARSNETLPLVVLQSSSTTTKTTDSKITTTTTTTTTNAAQHKSVVRINPAVKRNLRGKRRSTGIRPDEVSLANAVVDVSPIKLDHPSFLFFSLYYLPAFSQSRRRRWRQSIFFEPIHYYQKYRTQWILRSQSNGMQRYLSTNDFPSIFL